MTGYIYLVRHGQTVWNAEARKQGQQDSPLTKRGIEQATLIGKHLSQELQTVENLLCYVSPLGRARHSAQIIQQQLKRSLDYVTEDDLKEHGFGAWEGKTPKEIESLFPGESERRRKDHWNYTIPGGGESYALIHERACRLLEHIKGQNALLVTHEMISKAIRGAYLNLSKEKTIALKHPQNVIYVLSSNKAEEIILSS